MPYTNVPENLWPKMDRCVEDVMAKQDLSKKRAVAICHAQIVGEKALSDDMLIAWGGAVKALGEGYIEGYLVKFTDAAHLDMTGEFFDARTDYDLKDGERTSIYYHHGQDKTLGRRRIGEGTLKID